MKTRSLGSAVVAAALLCAAVGCNHHEPDGQIATDPPAVAGPKADEAHDSHPAGAEQPPSFAEAVAKLVALRDQIRDAFAAQNEEQGHEPLHEVGHLLEDLPGLAEKQVSPADLPEIKQTSDELFDLFAKVDEKMHGAEGAAYADVASAIDAGIERLWNLAPASDRAEPAAQRGAHE